MEPLHFVGIQIEAEARLCADGMIIRLTDDESRVVSELQIAPGVRLVADAEGVRTELIGVEPN